MSSEQRVDFGAQCAEASQYIRRFLERGEIYIAQQQKSTFGVRPEEMRQVTEHHEMSDLRAWHLTVACALQHVGRNSAKILIARLGHPAKSAAAAWEQVSRNTGVPVSDAKFILRLAVPMFLQEIKRRHVDVNYHETAA